MAQSFFLDRKNTLLDIAGFFLVVIYYGSYHLYSSCQLAAQNVVFTSKSEIGNMI